MRPSPPLAEALKEVVGLDDPSVVLRVPSTLVPGEYNLLLNPRHPQFKRLKISKPEAFDFDGRLWKDGVEKRRTRTRR